MIGYICTHIGYIIAGIVAAVVLWAVVSAIAGGFKD